MWNTRCSLGNLWKKPKNKVEFFLALYWILLRSDKVQNIRNLSKEVKGLPSPEKAKLKGLPIDDCSPLNRWTNRLWSCVMDILISPFRLSHRQHGWKWDWTQCLVHLSVKNLPWQKKSLLKNGEKEYSSIIAELLNPGGDMLSWLMILYHSSRSAERRDYPFLEERTRWLRLFAIIKVLHCSKFQARCLIFCLELGSPFANLQYTTFVLWVTVVHNHEFIDGLLTAYIDLKKMYYESLQDNSNKVLNRLTG